MRDLIREEISYQTALLHSGWCSEFAHGAYVARIRVCLIRARLRQLRETLNG